MNELKYYLVIFLRRLPYFLPVFLVVSAASVIVAYTLPPAYVSQSRLVVESPQIPEELAASTVQIPPLEQLQIIQQRLLTRSNMLDIARGLDVLPDLAEMSPDEIVESMRARTDISVSSGRNEATLMTISFEAPDARKAAAVLGEYLTIIRQEDVRFRRGSAGETLQFFDQRVDKLTQDLDKKSAEILEYKSENQASLPETLDYRLSQQSETQNRIGMLEQDIRSLRNQRERVIRLFEATGSVGAEAEENLSPDERRLRDLRAELDSALAVFSESSPKVKMLRAQLTQLEERIKAKSEADTGQDETAKQEETAQDSRRNTVLDIQLSEIDSRIETLVSQKQAAETRLKQLTQSIEDTPPVSIRLEKMTREYDKLKEELAMAQDRMARARTGEMIETRSRGQKISVIEPPAVPTEPTKPNRLLIAGGGVGFGLAVGFGLVLLLEVMNSTARRPEDLVKRFNIAPIATVPFIRTRRQVFVQRSLKVLLLLVILAGVPAAVYAVHTYYLPLDDIANRLMNKIGVRL